MYSAAKTLMLVLLLNPSETLPPGGSFPQTLLSTDYFVGQLIHGFKDYPLLVWTTEIELFPDLAEILIQESHQRFHPVELWQQSPPTWLRALKFEAGKPFYAIFPPTLANDSNNVMLEMLHDFTSCDNDKFGDLSECMEDLIFVFFSTLYDGSQEDPSILHQKDGNNYCYTPSNLLFLKYDFRLEQKTLIELQSLRAIRMRCSEKNGYSCTEIVEVKEPSQVLSYLSNEQLRNLIQVVWRRNHATNVFITGLSENDIFNAYGTKWENSKSVYLDRRLRDLRQLTWAFTKTVPIFELVRHVNISVTAMLEGDQNYFDILHVGYIQTELIATVYSSGLSLLHSIHFIMMYAAGYDHRYNPLTAKSLLGACGTLELIIIFGFVFLIGALRMQRYRLKDFIGAVSSALAPLIFQYYPYQSTRLTSLNYIWMASIWFSTVMYMSLLQSQRIAPSVQVGNDTFKDLEDRKMSFYAGYGAYGYVSYENGYSFEENSGTVARLARVVQKKQYWDVSTDEFQNFFELSQWAILVENVEVQPMSKVLTEAYSKNYHLLPDKIYVQMVSSDIYIPQGDYVAESFKRIKENGIWEYWYQTYLEKRDEDVVFGFRKRLQTEEKLWKDSETVLPFNMSDSVLLELITLYGIILSALVTFRVAPVAWARLKEWTRWIVLQLMRLAFYYLVVRGQ